MNALLSLAEATTVGGCSVLSTFVQGAGRQFVSDTLSGSSSTSASSGATLGGTGSITNSVSSLNEATLSPGASIESMDLGSLDLNGSLLVEWEANSSEHRLPGHRGNAQPRKHLLGLLHQPRLGLARSEHVLHFRHPRCRRPHSHLQPDPHGFALDNNYGRLNQIAMVPEPSAAFIAFLGASLPCFEESSDLLS